MYFPNIFWKIHLIILILLFVAIVRERVKSMVIRHPMYLSRLNADTKRKSQNISVKKIGNL